MLQQLRSTIILLFMMTVLTGGVYPLIVTGIAQMVFPFQSNGSLIVRGERTAGSELIGQPFSGPEYFWGRLSATGPTAYNAAASSGSNYGPLHPDLRNAAEGRIGELTMHGVEPSAIPVDLVTASGSGLDPHISPAAADVQVSRIARPRGMTEAEVRELVRQNSESRQFGILGEPRVNVLLLNLALDAASGN